MNLIASILRFLGTLGGLAVVVLFVVGRVRDFLKGVDMGAAGGQFHLVRCTRCNKELEYSGEFHCERERDHKGTEYG